MTLPEIAPERERELLRKIEALMVELSVYKRYVNRDIQAQVDSAFRAKRETGKFPFED